MKLDADTLRLSATDLANHLACRHVTALDRGAAGEPLILGLTPSEDTLTGHAWLDGQEEAVAHYPMTIRL